MYWTHKSIAGRITERHIVTAIVVKVTRQIQKRKVWPLARIGEAADTRVIVINLHTCHSAMHQLEIFGCQAQLGGKLIAKLLGILCG